MSNELVRKDSTEIVESQKTKEVSSIVEKFSDLVIPTNAVDVMKVYMISNALRHMERLDKMTKVLFNLEDQLLESADISDLGFENYLEVVKVITATVDRSIMLIYKVIDDESYRDLLINSLNYIKKDGEERLSSTSLRLDKEERTKVRDILQVLQDRLTSEKFSMEKTINNKDVIIEENKEDNKNEENDTISN